MIKERLTWLDTTKGVGLILVILGHNLGFIAHAPFWHGFIYSFHMPLFFFLGGCTLDIKSARNTARRATVHAYSYLLMAILIMPIAIVLTGYNHPSTQFEGVLYATGHTIDVSPLWFLSCLAIALLYAAAFIFTAKPNLNTPSGQQKTLIGSILFIALGYYSLIFLAEKCSSRPGWGDIQTSGFPWNAEVALTATGYILLGKLLFKRSQTLSQLKTSHLFGISAFFFLAIYWAYKNNYIHYDLNFRNIKPNIASAYIPILGIFGAISLGCALAKINRIGALLAKLGQSGLFVLWLHSGIQNRAIKLAFDKLHLSNDFLLWTISFIAAVIIPPLIDLMIIKKSRLLGRIFYPRFDFGVFKTPQKNFT